MECISVPKLPLVAFSRSLSPSHRHALKALPPNFPSFALISLRSPRRLEFVACFATLSGSGGGGGDDLAGGGGGEGGDGGGKVGLRSIAVGESNEALDLGKDEDVIILSVSGMACGGCATSVKRILESQPQVSLADVSFEKETALIWVNPEAKNTQNWQQELGELLANHLTTCGFKSDLRDGA